MKLTVPQVGLQHARGRGIEHMLAACKDAGVPTPKLRYEANGLWVEFQVSRQDVKDVGRSSGKMTGKMTGKILALLAEDPKLSIPEMASQTGKSVSTVERAIRTLRKEERIKRIGPAKGGHWQVMEADDE